MKWKINHLYSILWEDHYDDSRDRDDPKVGKPVLQITRGLLARVTPKMIVLSYSTPCDTMVSREDVGCILKRDIVETHDYGAEPDLPTKPKRRRK